MSDELSTLEGGGLFPRLQQRFGLREDPLAMESPFFPDAQRQHALETLRHLCGFGDMVLVLTGGHGFGKTRLLGELVRSESSRLEFVWLPTAALANRETLVKALYMALQRPVPQGEDPGDLIVRYMEQSCDATRKGRRQVLLLDDADQAAPGVISLLVSAFLASDPAAAAIPVLTGQPGLEDTLSGGKGAPLAESVHHIDLPALGRDDIEQFLKPRVAKAGGNVEELLSRRRIDSIFVLSQGSFGRLRRTAPAVWLDMASVKGPSLAVSGLAGWFRHARWAVLALALLSVSWWVVSRQYDDAVEREASPLAVSEPITRSVITIGPETESYVPAGSGERMIPEGDEIVSSVPQNGVEVSAPVLTDSEETPIVEPAGEFLRDTGEEISNAGLPEPEPEPEPEP
uniref:ATP-binding protein n=1 Tax=uncultured Marinobacter sp. TaxID=187379 RepID=UPI0030DBCF11